MAIWPSLEPISYDQRQTRDLFEVYGFERRINNLAGFGLVENHRLNFELNELTINKIRRPLHDSGRELFFRISYIA